MVTAESESRKKSTSRRWGWLVAAVVVGATCVAWRILWNKVTSADFAHGLAQSQPADPDAHARRLVLGVWTDQYQGRRTMTLNEDGTGTMIVELNGWRGGPVCSPLEVQHEVVGRGRTLEEADHQW